MKLYDFQQEIVEEVGDDSAALYLACGCGKTATALHCAQHDDRVLIVCQLSKIEDWQDEARQFIGRDDIVNLRKYKKDDWKWGVINYESLWRNKALASFSGTLILDESQKIKSGTAKVTKFVMSMKPSRILLLSGTPMGGKYEELYTQLKLLGLNMTKKEYWANFVVTRKWFNGVIWLDLVVGYKNLTKLYNIMSTELNVHMLKDTSVLNLPQKTFIDLHAKPTSHYGKYCRDGVWGDMMTDNPLVDLNNKRQLHSIIYSPAIQKRFTDVLDSLECERVVVFYNYTKEYEEARKLCGKRGISVINGRTRDLEKYNSDSTSVTFVQYQAGAEGLNLQRARYIVYLSPPLSAAKYMQSQKRIHRIGQSRPCFYYRITGAINDKIYEALERGEDYTEKLYLGVDSNNAL